MIAATDVLTGRWASSGYPFRYVVIWHGKELFARFRNKMMDTVLSAVEVLEDQGWELVSVDEACSLACLRRLEHDRAGQTEAHMAIVEFGQVAETTASSSGRSSRPERP